MIADEITPCQCCGTFLDVRLEDARTDYHFEGERGSPADPNKPIPLCPRCAVDHHLYWDGMWAEYYGSRL
jgi:hypothetical protein